MNIRLKNIKHFVVNFALVISSFSFYNSLAFATSDEDILTKQRADCAKNSAQTWSDSLNRCVGKAESKATRNAVEDCALIKDLTQRTDCHKKIAEQKTGLSANPDNLPEGTVGKSMIMNGIGTAYAVLGMINGLGSGGKSSSCTSKKIFGYTAMAGTLTDIWLKIKAKKQIEELKNKYQIDVKNNAFDAQSKAFVYLRDEQETVKDIAEREKTRNLLLTLGYGAASLMAIYEMTPMGQNPDCYKKETPQQAEPEAVANKPPPPNSPPTNVSETAVVPEAVPAPKPPSVPVCTVGCSAPNPDIDPGSQKLIVVTPDPEVVPTGRFNVGGVDADGNITKVATKGASGKSIYEDALTFIKKGYPDEVPSALLGIVNKGSK